MLGTFRDILASPLVGATVIALSLLYLGAKKYIEKYAENLAERHTKGWKTS